MKAIRFVWALLLFVGGGGYNQQQASQAATSAAATKIAQPSDTNCKVASSTTITDAPASFIPHLPPGFVLEAFSATNAAGAAKTVEDARARVEKSDALAQFELGGCYYKCGA